MNSVVSFRHLFPSYPFLLFSSGTKRSFPEKTSVPTWETSCLYLITRSCLLFLSTENIWRTSSPLLFSPTTQSTFWILSVSHRTWAWPLFLAFLLQWHLMTLWWQTCWQCNFRDRAQLCKYDTLTTHSISGNHHTQVNQDRSPTHIKALQKKKTLSTLHLKPLGYFLRLWFTVRVYGCFLSHK